MIHSKKFLVCILFLTLFVAFYIFSLRQNRTQASEFTTANFSEIASFLNPPTDSGAFGFTLNNTYYFIPHTFLGETSLFSVKFVKDATNAIVTVLNKFALPPSSNGAVDTGMSTNVNVVYKNTAYFGTTLNGRIMKINEDSGDVVVTDLGQIDNPAIPKSFSPFGLTISTIDGQDPMIYGCGHPNAKLFNFRPDDGPDQIKTVYNFKNLVPGQDYAYQCKADSDGFVYLVLGKSANQKKLVAYNRQTGDKFVISVESSFIFSDPALSTKTSGNEIKVYFKGTLNSISKTYLLSGSTLTETSINNLDERRLLYLPDDTTRWLVNDVGQDDTNPDRAHIALSKYGTSQKIQYPLPMNQQFQSEIFRIGASNTGDLYAGGVLPGIFGQKKDSSVDFLAALAKGGEIYSIFDVGDGRMLLGLYGGTLFRPPGSTASVVANLALYDPKAAGGLKCNEKFKCFSDPLLGDGWRPGAVVKAKNGKIYIGASGANYGTNGGFLVEFDPNATNPGISGLWQMNANGTPDQSIGTMISYDDQLIIGTSRTNAPDTPASSFDARIIFVDPSLLSRDNSHMLTWTKEFSRNSASKIGNFVFDPIYRRILFLETSIVTSKSGYYFSSSIPGILSREMNLNFSPVSGSIYSGNPNESLGYLGYLYESAAYHAPNQTIYGTYSYTNPKTQGIFSIDASTSIPILKKLKEYPNAITSGFAYDGSNLYFGSYERIIKFGPLPLGNGETCGLNIQSDKKYIITGSIANYIVSYKNCTDQPILNLDLTIKQDVFRAIADSISGNGVISPDNAILWAVDRIAPGGKYIASFTAIYN